MTPAERKAAERERNRKAGLKYVGVWAYPEDVEAIKEHAGQLRAVSATLRIRRKPKSRKNIVKLGGE